MFMIRSHSSAALLYGRVVWCDSTLIRVCARAREREPRLERARGRARTDARSRSNVVIYSGLVWTGCSAERMARRRRRRRRWELWIIVMVGCVGRIMRFACKNMCLFTFRNVQRMQLIEACANLSARINVSEFEWCCFDYLSWCWIWRDFVIMLVS